MDSATSAADRRMEELIALTDTLTDKIAAETRAFESRRPQDVAAGIGETSRLANIYRLESARLKQYPSIFEHASLAKRVALVRATEAFDAVLARHGRALEVSKSITEGLVHAIAREVASSRINPVGYSQNARSRPSDQSAITLNQSA